MEKRFIQLLLQVITTKHCLLELTVIMFILSLKRSFLEDCDGVFVPLPIGPAFVRKVDKFFGPVDAAAAEEFFSQNIVQSSSNFNAHSARGLA